MAEHFKKDSDEKGEDRSEHPIVEPQSSVNLSESLIDIGSKCEISCLRPKISVWMFVNCLSMSATAREAALAFSSLGARPSNRKLDRI